MARNGSTYVRTLPNQLQLSILAQLPGGPRADWCRHCMSNIAAKMGMSTELRCNQMRTRLIMISKFTENARMIWSMIWSASSGLTFASLRGCQKVCRWTSVHDVEYNSHPTNEKTRDTDELLAGMRLNVESTSKFTANAP